jgi:hypothetical protein
VGEPATFHRLKAALPVALAILGTAIFLRPARDGLLGDPLGETHNHLWALGRALTGVDANVPAGWTVPLMDPPNLPIFALGWIVSPIAAWNGLAVGNVLLAAAGGWVLGRELGGRAGAWTGMAAVAWSPFLGGAIEFGVTEAWPLGWYAFHLAALVRFRRTGTPGAAGIAGLSLGIFALSGWYHAAFALVVAPLAAGWVLAARRDARALGGLALIGVIGSALVAPRLPGLVDHLPVWADRAAGLSDPVSIRAWARQERYGIDLLAFLPAWETVTPSYSVYFGLTTLALGLAAGRAGWPWLGMAVPLWALALGHWVRAGGEPIRIGGEPLLGPAGWLVEHVEHARFVTHWYRAVGPATVLVAGAAAIGASRLVTALDARRPGLAAWVPPLLAALLLVDSLALSRTRWPRVAAPVQLPSVYAGISDRPGAILDLPIDDNQRRDFPYVSRRPYWLWQLWHGQPVTENYEGADSILQRSGQARALQSACGGLPFARPGAPDADRQDPGSEAVTLHDLGIRWVVVHREIAPEGCEEAVAALFEDAGEGAYEVE